jgi:hypothetical protein
MLMPSPMKPHRFNGNCGPDEDVDTSFVQTASDSGR